MEQVDKLDQLSQRMLETDDTTGNYQSSISQINTPIGKFGCQSEVDIRFDLDHDSWFKGKYVDND